MGDFDGTLILGKPWFLGSVKRKMFHFLRHGGIVDIELYVYVYIYIDTYCMSK